MEVHTYCELFPLHEDEVDELAHNMTKYGWVRDSAIIMFEDKILDGRHRYLAAQDALVDPIFIDFEGDATDALRFVWRINAVRRHMSNDEKKEAFSILREDGLWPKIDRRDSLRQNATDRSNELTVAPTNQEIADIMGVSESTIKRWDAERERPDVVVPVRADTTGTDEWYTPLEYIDMVREVMDGIDLDPATCEFAQAKVRASNYFTIENNGLEQYWSGRVWLNPPYSKGLMAKFVDKICEEYMLGDVNQATVLSNNFTDTAWFHKLLEVSSAVCFTTGRVKFYNQDGVGINPTNGHAFFYFGPMVEKFTDIFSKIGTVCNTERSSNVNGKRMSG